MLRVYHGVRARDQALALMLASRRRPSSNTAAVTRCFMSQLPHAVLCEFLRTWVLLTARSVVLVVTRTDHLDDDDDDFYASAPTGSMHVLVGVGHALGLTQGAPAVTWTGNLDSPVFALLADPSVPSKTLAGVSLRGSMSIVDTRGQRPTWTARSGSLGQQQLGMACGREWLVLSCLAEARYTLKVWKLENHGGGFPEGDPVVLDLGAAVDDRGGPVEVVPRGLFVIVKFAHTHFCSGGSGGGCIGDGDELSIVTDLDCRCSFKVVDVRKCFESGIITVLKQVCVVRDPMWAEVARYKFLESRRDGRLFIAYWILHKMATVIQDVESGVCTVLPISEVSQLDGSHYGAAIGEPTRSGIYQIGTNTLVREWSGKGPNPNAWSNGLFFSCSNNKISCFEAVSGIHIVSFSVVGTKKPPVFFCPMSPPF